MLLAICSVSLRADTTLAFWAPCARPCMGPPSMSLIFLMPVHEPCLPCILWWELLTISCLLPLSQYPGAGADVQHRRAPSTARMRALVELVAYAHGHHVHPGPHALCVLWGRWGQRFILDLRKQPRVRLGRRWQIPYWLQRCRVDSHPCNPGACSGEAPFFPETSLTRAHTCTHSHTHTHTHTP
jgi:hypothetical protein